MHDHPIQSFPATGSVMTAMAMASSVLALADRSMADAACDQSAKIILSIGGEVDAGGKGSLEFHFTGNNGTQALAFASASTAANVADAIQSFAKQTGIGATASSYGVDLYSVERGSSAFISVQQLGGRLGYVCVPDSGSCRHGGTDFGTDGVPGDANCDGHVNQADLDMVLAGWGPCPKPPEACPGDVDVNGVVNIDDLLRVINGWDNSPGQ
jgi:hypothetical protein